MKSCKYYLLLPTVCHKSQTRFCNENSPFLITSEVMFEVIRIWAHGICESLFGDGSLTLFEFTPSKISSGDSDLGVSRLLVSVSLSLPFFPPPPTVWVFMCLLKWSLRMKRLLHTGQANLFSPV